MTRKRFWGLRNALSLRLDAWAIENGHGKVSGVSNKKCRPVSGKPLVKFDPNNGFGMSYKEVWNSKTMRDLRKALGMEE